MFEEDKMQATLDFLKQDMETITPEEIRETLISAGIIYKNGRHTPPYRIIDQYFDKYKKREK